MSGFGNKPLVSTIRRPFVEQDKFYVLIHIEPDKRLFYLEPEGYDDLVDAREAAILAVQRRQAKGASVVHGYTEFVPGVRAIER